ncbi:12-oxophytodienoate reductase [Aspergillus avenaceus]|uniref:12-oxophytodienoate reductase n=1 Tax=Aspergillus avenaceus TaxID=36643 RepID=A0A5N6TR87_ASPAV|nr:12-oxophytodienoate reductase [Aspergillus avenaceus]
MVATAHVLQQDFTSRSLKLSHRVVLAPMTRIRASDTTGIPNSTAAAYYSQKTTSGGLLISEGTVVHPRGKGFPRTPGLWTEEQASAWKHITDAVHAKGGTFFVQLWHVGRVSVPSQTGGLAPLSSTTTHLPGQHLLFGDDNGTEPYVPSHAMTTQDIKNVIAQFSHAARLAVEVAGFDGVEIHGANSYLLDSFTHDNINTRTDEYGGSIEGRLKFALEVVDGVIDAIGSDKTAIRLAPYHILQETRDSDRIATFCKLSTELEARRLAYVHIVEPRYDQLSNEGAFSGNIQRTTTDSPSIKETETPTIWPFRHILKATPVIGAGGYDSESVAQAIHKGRIDMAAFGRHFTSNPDLPRRLFNGYPLAKYHRPTFYTSGLEGYLGWPRWEQANVEIDK